MSRISSAIGRAQPNSSVDLDWRLKTLTILPIRQTSAEVEPMCPTMHRGGDESDNGKTSAVDDRLARLHGGRPATWHARRCGPTPVNQLAAMIIAEWRECGDQEALEVWIRPIEAALGMQSNLGVVSPRLHAALADAAEDEAEAHFHENPCETTARALLRKRAADRRASLEYDQEIARRFGITM
jgi:hypothetical protein